MEFSKIVMAFASALYALTWAVVAAAVFADGEPPWQMLESLSWVYGAAIASYCGKTAYENRAKIERGAKDERSDDSDSGEAGGTA